MDKTYIQVGNNKIEFEKKIVGGTFSFNIPIKIDYFSEDHEEAAKATAIIILRDLEGSEAQAEIVRILRSRAVEIKNNPNPSRGLN